MSPDEAYGVLDDNGKWTGLIGLLVQDQADMSINDLTITFDRAQVNQADMSINDLTITFDRAQVNHYFVLTRLTQDVLQQFSGNLTVL